MTVQKSLKNFHFTRAHPLWYWLKYMLPYTVKIYLIILIVTKI